MLGKLGSSLTPSRGDQKKTEKKREVKVVNEAKGGGKEERTKTMTTIQTGRCIIRHANSWKKLSSKQIKLSLLAAAPKRVLPLRKPGNARTHLAARMQETHTQCMSL
jgi:hypothetical protein